MLISKEHGGLGFSPQAQSLILGKIASRSPDVVTIVMVPNSLGPGELIEKYGTDEQKHYYLPRLAQGLEVPCFSLTGPTSGSDAATMRDIGYVTKGHARGPRGHGHPPHLGQALHHARAEGDARRSRLPPLRSREHSRQGRGHRHHGRHDPGHASRASTSAAAICPSGAAFPNGPNWGKDVFIPIDWVIGGEKMVGQGWRMLMECLAAGRAISLPSSATAGAKAMLRFSTAYARIRRQFGLPIARMEGIEEPLARIVETAYVNEAARAVTAAMVSRGEKPVRDLGADEVSDDRAHAPRRQRRLRHPRRPRHLRRPVELPAVRLPARPRRHHRRRRQHPDAHADHLRPGRAALASLPLQGGAGAPGSRQRARPRRLRGCVPRPRHVLRGQCQRRLLPQRDARLLRQRARARRQVSGRSTARSGARAATSRSSPT